MIQKAILLVLPRLSLSSLSPSVQRCLCCSAVQNVAELKVILAERWGQWRVSRSGSAGKLRKCRFSAAAPRVSLWIMYSKVGKKTLQKFCSTMNKTSFEWVLKGPGPHHEYTNFTYFFTIKLLWGKGTVQRHYMETGPYMESLLQKQPFLICDDLCDVTKTAHLHINPPVQPSAV